MYKLFCITCCVLCTYCMNAQLENSNWVFGDSAGIKFLLDEESNFKSSIFSVESSASISDVNGNILFYSDGITVWNKENNVMLNGDSLFFNDYSYEENTSSTQGAIILNKPSSDSLFFVFSLAPFNSGPGLIYSTVNVKLNEELGEVVEKSNILISDSLTEKLSAIRHANGRDWWLIGHYLGTTNFYTFLIDPYGIHGPYVQSIGSIHSEMWGNIFGQIKFASTGDKLLSVSLNIIDLFDFDRCNGLLSNWVDISNKVVYEKSWLAYSCEFSSNSDLVYIVITKEDELFQLNISSDNLEKENFYLVYKDNSSNYRISQIALAPNGKIYMAKGYSGFGDFTENSINKLSVINYPDLSNESCGFANSSFALGDNHVFYGLPNLPNYSLGALQGSECDTLSTAIQESVIKETLITVYPNPATDYLYVETTTQEKLNLIIRDVKGSVCMQINRLGDEPINVSHLPVGIYSVIAIGVQSGKMYNDTFIKMQ